MRCRNVKFGAVLAVVVSMSWCISAVAVSAADHAPSVIRPAAVPMTVVLYEQPPDAGGGLLPSSFRDPDGGATDEWAWDNFTLSLPQTITEVRWRGARKPFGSGGPVLDFTVDIYPSIPGGSEPALAQAPLVHYQVGGDAGETPADILGGVQTYDYAFALPAPFQAGGGVKYWVQIEAFQAGTADWALIKGTGGNGQYYRKYKGNSSIMYGTASGDAAFALLGPQILYKPVYVPLICRY